jgi:hypothetical protein
MQWAYFLLQSCSCNPWYLPFQQSFQWTLTRPRPARPHTSASAAGLLDISQECPVTSDIQYVDHLNKNIWQYGDDLLEELIAHLSTTASLPAIWLIDEFSYSFSLPSCPMILTSPTQYTCIGFRK